MGRDDLGDWDEEEFDELEEPVDGDERGDIDSDTLWEVIERALGYIVHRGVTEAVVFTTGGGSHYHWYSDCPTLAKWQQAAFQQGFTPRPIERVYRSAALGEGRRECRTCRSHRLFQQQAGGEAA